MPGRLLAPLTSEVPAYQVKIRGGACSSLRVVQIPIQASERCTHFKTWSPIQSRTPHVSERVKAEKRLGRAALRA